MSEHLPIPYMAACDISRIWDMVCKAGEDGCWLWTGCKRAGYGRIRMGGRQGHLYVATRLIYWLTKGVDPGPLKVLHTCDNPPCCNPKHLWLGTDEENNSDKEVKGRADHPFGIDNGLARLTDADALAIRFSDETNRELARYYHVTDVAISCVRTGRTWKHVGGPIRASQRGNFHREFIS